MSISVLTSGLVLSASLIGSNPGTLDGSDTQSKIPLSDIPTLISLDEHRAICQNQANQLANQFLQLANQVLSYSLSQPRSITINLQKVPASKSYEIHAILRYPDGQQVTQSKGFATILDMHPVAPIESASLRLDTILKTHFTDVTCGNLGN